MVEVVVSPGLSPVGAEGARVSGHGLVAATIDDCGERFPAQSYASTEKPYVLPHASPPRVPW